MNNNPSDLEIRDIASKINAEVVAITAGLSEEWGKEFSTLNLPNEVLNKLWFETAFFGIYLLQKRFVFKLEEKTRDKLKKNIRQTFISTVSSLMSVKDNDYEELKEYITHQYDETIKTYENYSGVDIKNLFTDFLVDVFNLCENSKLKYIDNKLTTKLKLKLAFFLGSLVKKDGTNSFIEEHKDILYLPKSNLTPLSSGIAKAFSEVNESVIYD